MKWFRYFLCFLVIVQPVWTMYGCGGGSDGGSSDSVPVEYNDNTPISNFDTYSGESISARADTDEEGRVFIESDQLSTKYDITIEDTNGNPIPNIEVDYIEYDGLSLIVFADPNGKYVPAMIFSEPSAMSSLNSVNSFGGSVKCLSFTPADHSPLLLGTVTLLVVIASITIAELSFISKAYSVQTFYYSDVALAHGNWILYCKTIQEWADFEYDRLTGIIDLIGIAVTFVSAGSAAASATATYNIKKEVISQGEEILADYVAEIAVHEFGSLINADETTIGIQVWPIENGQMRNMWAPYILFLSHPICEQQEGALSGTLVDAVTGLGIEGSVTVGSETVSTTNSNYSFSTIDAGTVSATASAPGYESSTKAITIEDGIDATLNFALSPVIFTSGEYRIVLEWGASPSDLDSHLYTPILSDGSDYHIYYGYKGSLTSQPFCTLDVDDITSYGPETITIKQGADDYYTFKVHHYSGSSTLALSGATVKLYGDNGLINTWNVPNGNSTSRLWNLFDINPISGSIINNNILE